MAGFTKDERLVVLWQQGKTIEVIASELAMATSAVRTRLHQLRQLGVPLRVSGSSGHGLALLEKKSNVPRLIALAEKEGGRAAPRKGTKR